MVLIDYSFLAFTLNKDFSKFVPKLLGKYPDTVMHLLMSFRE